MAKYEEYIRLAENDLKVAELLLNSANDELMQNSAAYHAEQAVEKTMKGLLVKNGRPAGISHNITELSKDLDEINAAYPDWINDKDDEITTWSTTIRYNANFKSDHDEIEEIIRRMKEWLNELQK